MHMLLKHMTLPWLHHKDTRSIRNGDRLSSLAQPLAVSTRHTDPLEDLPDFNPVDVCLPAASATPTAAIPSAADTDENTREDARTRTNSSSFSVPSNSSAGSKLQSPAANMVKRSAVALASNTENVSMSLKPPSQPPVAGTLRSRPSKQGEHRRPIAAKVLESRHQQQQQQLPSSQPHDGVLPNQHSQSSTSADRMGTKAQSSHQTRTQSQQLSRGSSQSAAIRNAVAAAFDTHQEFGPAPKLGSSQASSATSFHNNALRKVQAVGAVDASRKGISLQSISNPQVQSAVQQSTSNLHAAQGTLQSRHSNTGAGAVHAAAFPIKPTYTAEDRVYLKPEQRLELGRKLRSPKRRTLVRIFKYGLDDLRLFKALEEAGWASQSVVVETVDAADVVVAAQIKRTGKQVEMQEVKNAATKAGKPFVLLKAVSGLRLAKALCPILGIPVPQHLLQQSQARPRTVLDKQKLDAPALRLLSKAHRQLVAGRIGLTDRQQNGSVMPSEDAGRVDLGSDGQQSISISGSDGEQRDSISRSDREQRESMAQGQNQKIPGQDQGTDATLDADTSASLPSSTVVHNEVSKQIKVEEVASLEASCGTMRSHSERHVGVFLPHGNRGSNTAGVTSSVLLGNAEVAQYSKRPVILSLSRAPEPVLDDIDFEDDRHHLLPTNKYDRLGQRYQVHRPIQHGARLAKRRLLNKKASELADSMLHTVR